jgi:hypothetical protein
VGFGSGVALLTGSNNIFLGYNAGGVVDGCFNVAIGQLVCVASSSGSCQLAIGFAAGQNWLTGTSTKAIKPGAGIIDCANSCGTAGQVLVSTGANAVCWGAPAAATPSCLGTVLGRTGDIHGNNALGKMALGNITSNNFGGRANTAVGEFSGAGYCCPDYNTSVGFQSLLSAQGSYNTAVGALANNELVTGACNTVFGYRSGGKNNSGCCNTYTGFQSGCARVTGNSNVAIGADADSTSTAGSQNVAIGSSVRLASTTGSCQLAIGFSPTDNWLTGTSTKAIKPGAGIIDCANSCGTAGQVLVSTGANAVCWGTVGGGSPATPTTFGTVKGNVNNLCRNVSLGCNAFNVTGTGDDNTAVGDSALVSATTGFRNVAIGSKTLCSLTTGLQNIAIGMTAGQSITTGIDNVIVGSYSGNSQTTGNQNTFIGSMIGFMVPTTGSNNTSIGFMSGGFTTGSCNLAIGFQTSVANAAGSGQLSIGFAAGDCWWLRGNSTRAIQPGAGIIDCAGSCGTAGQVLMSNGANAICWGAGGGGASAATPTVAGTVLGRTSATSVALGCNALLSNTTGTNNTALGLSAGCAITTGSCNVAIGNGVQVASATGNCQLAIGYSSTCNWLTGCSDKTIRPGAGILDCVNSAGNAATPFANGQVLVSAGVDGVVWCNIPGAQALSVGGVLGCTIAAATALGCSSTSLAYALNPLCVQDSVSIGNNLVPSIPRIVGSVFVGARILGTGGGGTYTDSVVIGNRASCVGLGASQINNVVIGAYSASCHSGSCNTFVGACAAATGATIAGNNLTVIGYNAQPSSFLPANEVTLGNSSVVTLRAAVTSITGLSDARDKTDVTALPVGLDFVNSLNPVKFTWQMREPNEVKDGTSEAGFIAQDLQVAQETSGADYLGLVYDANPDKLEASAGKLIPVLVKAIQELSAKVEELEAKLEANG